MDSTQTAEHTSGTHDPSYVIYEGDAAGHGEPTTAMMIERGLRPPRQARGIANFGELSQPNRGSQLGSLSRLSDSGYFQAYGLFAPVSRGSVALGST